MFDIPNKNYEKSMGDFWAESVRLASQAKERFLCLLGQGKSRLNQKQSNSWIFITIYGEFMF